MRLQIMMDIPSPFAGIRTIRDHTVAGKLCSLSSCCPRSDECWLLVEHRVSIRGKSTGWVDPDWLGALTVR